MRCSLYQFCRSDLKLGFVDLIVTSRLVIGDDPFVRETWLINVMIPKSRRGDFRSENCSLLHACNRVNAESSCKFHLESRKVTGSMTLIKRNGEDRLVTHPTSKYKRGSGMTGVDDF